MARKRTKKPQKYIIQHGKLQHQTSARRFAVWLRAGLLVLVNSHLARVSESARTLWEGGELILQPIAQVSPSIAISWAGVEQQYLFAHGGQVPLTRDQRAAFADWRLRFGLEEALRMEREYLSREREFAMREQYGWL